MEATGSLSLVTLLPRANYEPSNYLSDDRLLSRVAQLPDERRWSFAELLAGNMHQHTFYAVKKREAGDDIMSAIPTAPLSRSSVSPDHQAADSSDGKGASGYSDVGMASLAEDAMWTVPVRT